MKIKRDIYESTPSSGDFSHLQERNGALSIKQHYTCKEYFSYRYDRRDHDSGTYRNTPFLVHCNQEEKSGVKAFIAQFEKIMNLPEKDKTQFEQIASGSDSYNRMSIGVIVSDFWASSRSHMSVLGILFRCGRNFNAKDKSMAHFCATIKSNEYGRDSFDALMYFLKYKGLNGEGKEDVGNHWTDRMAEKLREEEYIKDLFIKRGVSKNVIAAKVRKYMSKKYGKRL
mgnify:CR=1 FL=1